MEKVASLTGTERITEVANKRKVIKTKRTPSSVTIEVKFKRKVLTLVIYKVILYISF